MPINMPAEHPSALKDNLTCGTCQWYLTGYLGRSCRSLREVEPNTRACLEYEEYMNDPFTSICNNDKLITELRKDLKNNYDIEDSELISEVNSYILKTDNLTTQQLGVNQNLTQIVITLKSVLAIRQRLSQINTSVIDLNANYEEVLTKARMWVYARYKVVRELKNEQLRTAAFDRILPEKIPIEKKLHKVMALIKYLDEKLKDNEYTIRMIIQASEKIGSERA